MDTLPVRVVNVDSRTRVGTAGDASNFQIELQEPVEMPRGAVCWVTEMQLPVVWRNIEPTLNGRLYIREIDNRAVAHLPNLDAIIFTDHLGGAAHPIRHVEARAARGRTVDAPAVVRRQELTRDGGGVCEVLRCNAHLGASRDG